MSEARSTDAPAVAGLVGWGRRLSGWAGPCLRRAGPFSRAMHGPTLRAELVAQARHWH
jgi:hypothetical protein